MTQKRNSKKKKKEEDDENPLFKTEYSTASSVLEVKITPKPPCGIDIFLIKFGGELLKRLYCLYDNRRRCACLYYFIYKNKQTNNEFIMIKSMHPAKVWNAKPFIAKLNKKSYKCKLFCHFEGIPYNEI